jgi:1-acyl-sn-glycerol-3-phosphate acyltransferase
MGWKDAEPKLINIMGNNKKLVVLFPHTSKWDLILTLAYFKECDSIKQFKNKIKIIANKSLTQIPFLEPILTDCNAIFVGKGSLNSIFEELDKMNEFILLISPKGSLNKKRWERGWYEIANRYDANVVAAGPDFLHRTMKSSGSAHKLRGRSIEEMEKFMKKRMNKLVPYHPEEEFCNYKGDVSNIELVDPSIKDSYIVIGFAVLLMILISTNT